jgi:hypothetical protein
VSKVKKAAAVTGVRNVKASKKKVARKSSAATKGARNRVAKASKVSKGAQGARTGKAGSSKSKDKSMSRVNSISKARAKAAKARLQAEAPVVRVAVKPLEPQAKCGAGTSVQYLFRVDETVDGRTTAHLVFFDRHGWYCEHGRNCPAVGHAKKYQGHMARAS